MNFVRLKDFQFHFQTISNIVARQTVCFHSLAFNCYANASERIFGSNDFLLIKPLLPPVKNTKRERQNSETNWPLA